jgi:hypothetical protein
MTRTIAIPPPATLFKSSEHMYSSHSIVLCVFDLYLSYALKKCLSRKDLSIIGEMLDPSEHCIAYSKYLR